jgi:hypothetical protein
MAGTVREAGLSPDLIPFISKPQVSMAVVQVRDMRWSRQMDGDIQVDIGPVTLYVVSSVFGALREGQLIEVPAKRIVNPAVRVRHNFDAWNTFSLVPRDLLLLAVRPGDTPTNWTGVAGQAVASTDAPDVQAVLRAYAIEEAKGNLAAKAEMLDGALRSGNNLLIFYAIDYLRRHASERETAVGILARAVSVPLSSNEKLEVGRGMVGAEFFVRSAKADAANIVVVTALSNALALEPDGARRVVWAQLLVSTVLMDFTGDAAENGRIRLALAHAPSGPVADRVASAITSAENFAAPDALPKLRELKSVFEIK